MIKKTEETIAATLQINEFSPLSLSVPSSTPYTHLLNGCVYLTLSLSFSLSISISISLSASCVLSGKGAIAATDGVW